MAIVCWGSLAKSANDTQKIEEAIQDYVEEHNLNVNAHQVEGSSLYMHRIQEQIDHKDGSIDLRKLSSTKKMIFTCFESLDGWSTSGSCYAGILDAVIYTSSTADEYAYLFLEKSLADSGMDPTKNPFFQTNAYIQQEDEYLAYIVAGSFEAMGDPDSFGFKMEDGDLYAIWTCSDTPYTEEISGIDLTEVHTYRAYIDSIAGTLNFYVDGVLKYQTSDNLPVTVNDGIFEYYIKTKENSRKYLYILDLLYTQDR